MINVKDYYLDLKVLNDEKDLEKRRTIQEYYSLMLMHYQEKQYEVMHSIFYTLIKSGYLLSIRGEKLEKILNED